MKDLRKLLDLLAKSPLDFVLVGGFAAVLHGSTHTTRDLDICVLFSKDEIDLLYKVLKPIHPVMSKNHDEAPLSQSLNDGSGFKTIRINTDLGILDVVSHIEGVGNYYDVLKSSEEIKIFDDVIRLISLDDLIKCKNTLGRHRDLAIAEELESLKKERET
ncbi:MAG: hypothetical protein HQM16_09445 [Deltaproteobacteria bacterium]|nr:hypothetical protein [Deltaproteobacteria bacterium]